MELTPEEELSPFQRLTREVYARFGLAYYLTECVHRGLAQALVFLSPQKLPSRPRIEEHLLVTSQMTFGELVPRAKDVLPTGLHDSLDWALVKRNFLAHGFWYERIHQMTSEEGMTDLLDELQEAHDVLSELNRAVDDLVLARHRIWGVTDEMYRAAMEESLRSPPEPLPTRKIPKTEERIQIVRAWVVRISAQHATLVLEEPNGDRWQLCDVGLCWCYLSDADRSWEPFEKLELPATIVARPKGSLPWRYKLHVSTGWLICVDHDDANGPFKWRAQRI